MARRGDGIYQRTRGAWGRRGRDYSLKIIAGTLVVVGIVVGFIELRYAPHTLLRESSPDRPCGFQRGLDGFSPPHSDYVHRARLLAG